ncbi:redox-regulated ATPase YchF [Texas Phoenix palm phytoplasma]|uniref:Ribosome-binding ATPase YchF n=1 Tax=Texas Phoenix palm phytoplasma TaxID=176709 RepID=A0ABS5BI35_9MOLU|nr:redox-regulated ATPase YchF [Texas Phoenix palm phytoplasma]MBP3059243.1 redox-regulated ATPase YchF [Texas Phoenix palm phytoplasma]
MKVGIIGLPNIGKSTLFNALTNMKVLEANYPFATIKPNIGIVEVPDYRLNFLSEIFKSEKIIKTQIEFIDIAGLVQNAYKGEGLGNQFLGQIRNVDVICHVVKCFENKNIIHIRNKINPIEEINIIETELILSDLEQIEKYLNKINKTKNKFNLNKNISKEIEILNKIKKTLEKESSINNLKINKDELNIIKNFNLLCLKPMLYIGNFEEKDLKKLSKNLFFQQMKNYSKINNKKFIPICILLEKELSSFSEKEEKINFLKTYNIKKSALEEIIQQSYQLLDLQTYFTAGKKEVKAWSFKKGTKAPECAKLIHTDLQRGFIKASVFNYEDLKKFPNLSKIKEKGKIRIEGKDYLVQDGDIIIFHFNV